jgi:ribokinase
VSVRLVVCGSFTLDNVIAPSGERLPRRCGGNVAYAAAGAALWSDGVGLVSRIGSDYPDDFLAALAGRGLDLGGVRRQAMPHGMNVAFWYRPDGSRERRFPAAVMASIPEGERARFTDYTTFGPAHRYATWFACSPEPADIPDDWTRTAAGCHDAALPVQRHQALMAHLRARRPDIALQVDSPWYDERDLAADHATPLLGLIDTLLPSEADLAVAAPGADPLAAARALLARGARRVVVKQGGAGSTILSADGGPAHMPAIPVAVVDPTGAGDAYCGGFLAGLVATGDPLRAAACGTVSASFAVETVGPLALLDSSRAAARTRLDALWARIEPSTTRTA